MTKKISPKTTKKNEKDEQTDDSYSQLGIIFLIIGAALFFTDTARAAGIVFLLVGVVFFASTGLKARKNKPSKKK